MPETEYIYIYIHTPKKINVMFYVHFPSRINTAYTWKTAIYEPYRVFRIVVVVCITVVDQLYTEQDKQRTYNVTLRRIRATTVAAEKR